MIARPIGPTLERELQLRQQTGSPLIAGLDEAGRGALAGPVVAAAVILPLGDASLLTHLPGVNDSKLLTPGRRETLAPLICELAVAWAVGQVPPEAIDEGGILPATRLAMSQAIAALRPAPTYLLIDGGVHLRALSLPQETIVRGDALSVSIAAASILAKVTRDRLMVALDGEYPAYGLAQHKGYCTPQHVASLAAHGPSPIHRLSFAPIRKTLL
jgi:ribonuclease HII